MKMNKCILLIFIALVAVTVISAASNNCGRHGDLCESTAQCCPNLKCHRYAKRCQVQITEEELMKQREKILGRKGKDY
ncbi:omega-conotoxin-like protein 1 [Xylocopa sonorina]|uniref:omega-conotoxin-like protein 1 n=1 Tax=Xylocopa sonorina TaxID=1818115 RepID=UPI00403B100B